MKYILFTLGAALSMQTFAQNDKVEFKKYKPGYYQNTILKGINQYESTQEPEKEYKRVKVDLKGKDLPNDPALYETIWHTNPISQGNTGTCWCFSTTSFYESEVQRLSGKEVKLSEMYTVYWEYVERAKYFVKHRGDMTLGEGSETNAVAKIISQYVFKAFIVVSSSQSSSNGIPN